MDNWRIVVMRRMDIKFVFWCGFLTVAITSVSCMKIVYSNEGEMIQLNCSLIPPLIEPLTTWIGPPTGTLYFYNERVNPNAPRKNHLSVVQNTSSKAYNLQIRNLTKNLDYGNYSCSVQLDTLQEEFFKLEFYVDVLSVSLSPSNDPLTITEGIQTEVLCIVNNDAAPPPVITWYLTSTGISYLTGTNTSSIRFTGNRTDNNKTLQCNAKNNNKPPMSASTTLNVLYKPAVKSDTQNPYIVNEGQTATLKCLLIAANPKTSISWRWYRADNPINELYAGSSYSIPNIQRDMSRSYSCTASNSVGTSEAVSIHIDIQYKPDVILSSNPYHIEEGNTATLNCILIAANPNTSISWRWYKTDNPMNVLNTESNYLIPNIQRNRSGSYSCTANNSVGTSLEATTYVDVLYKPEVELNTSPYHVEEGTTATLNCKLIAANPNTSISWRWYKTDNPMNVLNTESSFSIPNIQRDRSGSYSCIANNSVGTSEAVSIYVDIQYEPEVLNSPGTIVNESETVTLFRQIVSNPLSNVSWYNGSELLKTQLSENNATFLIKKATCTDTKNFTLIASNSVQKNVTAMVELIVNCKPRSFKTNFTIGVTDTTGIDFSTIIIAYPKPLIELEYENGTVPDQMMRSIFGNAVNNFTIRISQAVVNQSDFGIYHLKARNLFGEITMIVNVIAQRKPNMPDNIKIVCEATRAEVKWKSSFNGGDPQLFTVFASNGQQSYKISDKGENLIHSTFVQSLQPSTMYVFYVSAQNSHGFISSEKISCTTLAESSDKLPIIVGSAAASGLTLVVILVVVVFLFRRYTNTEKQAGKSQRFENDLVENESVDDDGLKDNILYVSADPKENEKHEATVYAAVNKKDPMSNNNSNVYAEVKKNGIKGVKEGAIYSDVKPKKGFLKKDGKVKKEKRQKRKQEVADVYENSDDIAMTANPDNVYSNTNQNNDSAKEQQGYKNKDGLLYVEVQFDTKTKDKNPVIHGDDEKTDYATVEFPVPSSSHDRE